MTFKASLDKLKNIDIFEYVLWYLLKQIKNNSVKMICKIHRCFKLKQHTKNNPWIREEITIESRNILIWTIINKNIKSKYEDYK